MLSIVWARCTPKVSVIAGRTFTSGSPRQSMRPIAVTGLFSRPITIPASQPAQKAFAGWKTAFVRPMPVPPGSISHNGFKGIPDQSSSGWVSLHVRISSYSPSGQPALHRCPASRHQPIRRCTGLENRPMPLPP
ncbi:hypothetical protein AGR2A_Lc80107 [Agrobacterium genomosp. 2 str. CFBP 5494]|uniref:Uncharacterized protein n=1 Tax=Agrobacterium genomosp. 2 str. CFBP 5494 TaxID=1183436 RepID=A0A9W5F4V6_9HYPH|nr:hypothetical protein AGR2A_Lc80107 [Agrobacterium genomosp. 2 str. CFBP 5494]